MHDQEVASRLRAGDEAAFRELVAEYSGRLARLARSFSRNEAVIEEAVQETWMAVIRGIHAFEGRAPLCTWLFGILANIARRLAVRERRHADLALAGADEYEREPGLAANGGWAEPPTPWGLEDPETALLSKETLGVIDAALADLPESQRQVVLLRDVEGVGPEQTCNILGISDTHQRVLLHRGRSRVRQALDRYMKEGALAAKPVRAARA